jgi:hypothetical protein
VSDVRVHTVPAPNLEPSLFLVRSLFPASLLSVRSTLRSHLLLVRSSLSHMRMRGGCVSEMLLLFLSEAVGTLSLANVLAGLNGTSE